MSKEILEKKIIAPILNVQVTKSVNENTSFMPMAGWHDNYSDFTLSDGRRGTIVFMNGSISFYIKENDRCKKVYSFNTGDVLMEILKQLEEKQNN